MANIGQLSHAAKAIAKEPWCVLTLFYLFYMGSAATDKYLLEGQPVTGALSFAWERSLAFAQLPLVQLLMIPLALYMFGHGVRRVMRHQEEAKGHSISAYQSKLDEYRSEMAPILSAIRYVTEAQHLDSILRRIDSFEIMISQTDSEITQFIDSLPFEVRDGELMHRIPTRYFPSLHESAFQLQIANRISAPIPELRDSRIPSKRDTTPPMVPGLGRSPAPRGLIEHDQNIDVFDSWREQINRFREFGTLMRQNVQDRRRSLQTIIDTLRNNHEH